MALAHPRCGGALVASGGVAGGVAGWMIQIVQHQAGLLSPDRIAFLTGRTQRWQPIVDECRPLMA
ncbi:MAG: hypothetical protein EBZ76_00985 [Synechococcaceae bacterium WB9_2_170]|nr:hypothetical protein [Synechococcaceae bacterium WB9_2_170]